MISLADDDQGLFLHEARRVIDAAQSGSTVLTVECGRVMRNNRGKSIEHFGYVDCPGKALICCLYAIRAAWTTSLGSSKGGDAGEIKLLVNYF
jgi:hypothetical protein